MISNRIKIGVGLVIILIGFSVYCTYAAAHAFDTETEPETYSFPLVVEDNTLEVTMTNYVGGDPNKMIQYTIVNPGVRSVYILFKASELETDNPSLVKATASVGEALGAAIGRGDLNMTPDDVIPREITWFRRVLIYSGIVGTESKPIIYFKTPNVGGTEDRIIVMKHIIILESSTYENAIMLASYIRYLVMS
ncbi:MAG: hypothetical protein HXS41_12150 [Theionarchaea archaeon]|nr:hypothetical protein [Theionarchaea archaeon]MBU7021803.1 hypothetical protein [Theionarchaea archaeon]MBU7034133.1 hypothetical protein [Theionarchaea archaeon]MBU7040030.1 hypothetical protein [Theionarchaea archaeon]